MTDRVSTSHLLRRVAARAGVGVWRNRGGVLVAVAACLAVAGYMTVSSVAGLPAALSSVGVPGGAGSSDCADAAIAAIADRSPTASHRAYQCMDASFQQRVPEQVFVQQLQTQSLQNVQTVDRLGDYHAPTGGTMVYYAVNASGQTVGYIVYLGQNGKVLRIE